jgi:hypothetical protein
MDPPYLGLLKGNYGISGMSWFKDYQKAFINTSRFRPIQHVMGFVLILGYCLEYPHLKRAHEHRATAPSPPAPPQRPRAQRTRASSFSWPSVPHFISPDPLCSHFGPALVIADEQHARKKKAALAGDHH